MRTMNPAFACSFRTLRRPLHQAAYPVTFTERYREPEKGDLHQPHPGARIHCCRCSLPGLTGFTASRREGTSTSHREHYRRSRPLNAMGRSLSGSVQAVTRWSIDHHTTGHHSRANPALLRPQTGDIRAPHLIGCLWRRLTDQHILSHWQLVFAVGRYFVFAFLLSFLASLWHLTALTRCLDISGHFSMLAINPYQLLNT